MEASPINVILHLPKDEGMQKELAKRVAIVHAQTVVEKIKALSCPVEQKLQLFDAIQNYIIKRDGP